MHAHRPLPGSRNAPMRIARCQTSHCTKACWQLSHLMARHRQALVWRTAALVMVPSEVAASTSGSPCPGSDAGAPATCALASPSAAAGASAGACAEA
jgi:hypothetical protein